MWPKFSPAERIANRAVCRDDRLAEVNVYCIQLCITYTPPRSLASRSFYTIDRVTSGAITRIAGAFPSQDISVDENPWRLCVEVSTLTSE